MNSFIRSSEPYDDLIHMLKVGVRIQRGKLRDSRQRCMGDLTNLRLRLDRLKGPPDNFIEAVILQNIDRGEAMLPVFDEDEKVLARALDMLAEYSYGLVQISVTVEAPTPPSLEILGMFGI